MSQLDPARPATEPVFNRGLVVAAVTALLALLVAFGVPIDDAQQTAILGFIAAAAPIVAAVWARRSVDSPATVARKVSAARSSTSSQWRAP